VNRSKSAQLLFADARELDRLIEEAELPEEFLASYSGGLADTVSQDFRDLLERSDFLALDSGLIQRQGSSSTDGMDATVAEKYRANLCQRLVGGMFVRLVVFGAQHAGGPIRDPQQRELLEWIKGLQRSLDELVQRDTRSELAAMIIVIFDRPLMRSDVAFLHELRTQPIVKRVYVMTERLRVTGEGRGLIHSRYVWPLAVGPLLLRIAAKSQAKVAGPIYKAPLFAWRAGTVPSAANRAQAQRERVRDVSQIFFGNPSKEPSPREDSDASEDAAWIKDRSPQAAESDVAKPPTRVARLLGDLSWRSWFERGAMEFARARVGHTGFDHAGHHMNTESSFWINAARDPKNLFRSERVFKEPEFHSTSMKQQERLIDVRERQRQAEYEVACARGCAREWAEANAALVSLPYRIFVAAIPAVMLLGFPAYLILYRFFGLLASDANNKPMIAFLGAVLASVAGALLGAWVSYYIEHVRLQEADEVHKHLVSKVEESRWTAFKDAGEIVREGENFRVKELVFHGARHRSRLVDRARSLMEAGLRDAQLDQVEDDVIEIVGIPDEEVPLAVEDIAEFRHALAVYRLVQDEKSSQGTDGAHVEGQQGIPWVDVPRTDTNEVITDIVIEWAMETPKRDMRRTGRLPARWLRTFVARLARKFRFNEAARADSDAKKRMQDNPKLINLLAEEFKKFFENHIQIASDKFRSPLLSVETVQGKNAQRWFFVIAADKKIAQDLADGVKLGASNPVIVSPLEGRVSSIGCSALCFEEILVELCLPNEAVGGVASESSAFDMCFTYDDPSDRDDKGGGA
jgi:hypothetical protein